MAAERTYTPGPASVEEMLGLHRGLGISRVVVVQPSPYGSDNRCTLDAVGAANAGGRDVARAVVVTGDGIGKAELRGMHAAGARGVRVNLQTHGLQDPAGARRMLLGAAALVADLGWHVQVYTSLGIVEQLAETVRRLPVPVVFDHFAGLRGEAGMEQRGMATLLDLLGEGNTYIKLSAAQRASNAADAVDLGPIVRRLVERRFDRLLWGTDWPHPGAWPGVKRSLGAVERFHPIDDGRALSRLSEWVPDEDNFASIVADNPARLYGWA